MVYQFFFKSIIAGLIIISLNSCATVFGGAKYIAVVSVPNHPDALISLNGKTIGKGTATVKIKRIEADKLNFTVYKDDYKKEYFSFHSRKMRGAALGASLFFSAITRINQQDANGNITGSTFFPFQIIIDLLNYSSLFKPNKEERGIEKVSSKRYKYILKYKAKPIKKYKPVVQEKRTKNKNEQTFGDKLRELKKLKEEGLITEKEHQFMKNKLMGINAESLENEKANKEGTVEGKDSEEMNTKGKDNDSKIILREESKKGDNEKINDLNKMLEMGLITQKEYDKMLETLFSE